MFKYDGGKMLYGICLCVAVVSKLTGEAKLHKAKHKDLI